MSLLYKIPELTASIITIVMLFLLIHKTYKKSIHFHYVSLITAGIVLILVSLINDSVIPNSLLSLLGMLMELCMIKYLYELKLSQATLTVILFNVWDVISTNLVMNLFLLSGNYTQDSLFTSGTNERLLYLITIYLVQCMTLYLFLKLHQRNTYLSGKRLTIALLFFLSDFLMVFLMHLILQSINILSPRIIKVCFSLTVLMFVTTIIVLFLLDILYTEQQKEQERQLLELQLADQQQTVRKMQEQYDSIRVIRHDMKNTLINYRIMLQDGHPEQVIQDINTFLNGPLGAQDISFTENTLLNALLHETKKKCLQNNIQFQCRIQVSALYEDLKFMVLLANLFDNAYEAECKEPADKRLILIDLVEKKHQLSVVIQNYISQSVLKSNPELYTSKQSSTFHGLGIKSVRTVIEERNGMLQIYEQGNMFSVHILISKDPHYI